jgi:intracellular septation protein
MQALLDFAPLLAFALAYHYLGGIYAATAVLMGAMAVLLAIDWLRLRRLPFMHVLSAGLVFLFGGVTLWLRSPIFLKWKPTILLWVLALGFAISTWFAKPLLQRMLEPTLPEAQGLTRRTWLVASWLWAAFYLLLGGVNLLVAYHATESAWVNFKVYGLTAATMLFAVASSFWMLRNPAPAS